jgi:hypothetical protein
MRSISIYDGQTLIGSITGADKDWWGFDAKGNPIKGKFETLKAAVAAINVSVPLHSCVGDNSARMDGTG